jgi:DNA-binding IclR family transcriptional regulator
VPTAPSTRAVDRALQLLSGVTSGSAGRTLSELAREAGLSPSTSSRLLGTLERHGFVRRDGDGRYRPGDRLVQVATATLREDPLYEVAGPHLEALARETGETANLGIRIEGDRALYLRHVASPQLVRTAAWTGRTIPLDGTAMGAALRGDVGPAGYAATRTTIEPDVTAVAAPVVEPPGAIAAALGVIAPTYRTSNDDVDAIGRALVRHAAAVSRGIGAPVPGRPA